MYLLTVLFDNKYFQELFVFFTPNIIVMISFINFSRKMWLLTPFHIILEWWYYGETIYNKVKQFNIGKQYFMCILEKNSFDFLKRALYALFEKWLNILMTTRDNFVTQEMMFKWVTFLKNIYFHLVDIFLFYILSIFSCW